MKSTSFAQTLTRFFGSIDDSRKRSWLPGSLACGSAILLATAGVVRSQPSGPTVPTPPASTQPVTVEGAPNPLPPAASRLNSVKFTVREFTFSGNNLLPSTDLAPLFKSLQGRPITYSELAEACKQVTELYRERGFLLATATIPVQQVRSGQLDIRITEGYVAAIRVRSDKAQLVSLAEQSFQPLVNQRPLTVAMVDKAVEQFLERQRNVSVRLTFTLQRSVPGPAMLSIQVNSVGK